MGLAFFQYSTPIAHWSFTIYSIAGGLLFGAAASMNGGCTFSTLTRLGDGDVNFAATVVGWPVGAWIVKIINLDASQIPTRLSSEQLIDTPLLYLAAAIAVVWLIWQMAVILGRRPHRARPLQVLLSPTYKLSIAAALIALFNLILFENFGPWSFTSVILSTVAPVHFPSVAALPIHWLVLGFTLAGIVVSSIQRKSFSLQRPKFRRLAAHGAAGVAMGFGAAMIPGGNDSLILYGISSFSPHALPAFMGILAGIALTFVGVKRLGGTPPRIQCSGDMCVTPIKPGVTLS